ncbi:hypothetical protein GOB07_01210 [Sinorhizobium meliloti]|nr:hypothetical protein [Sinorhizobium meliloti]MDX0372634.1 hypothetical protein [Sinorhizobium meliloti]
MLACSERKLNRPATSWAALPCGSNSCGVCPKGWCVLAAHHIATINLTNNQSVSDVSEQTSVMSPG